ncbi:ArsR family transcriptional regulator [Sphaerimonospora thailandensis]|uniref:ArsR family transcriptional regulator n=2 Tax=Sphaerimonospora thailandensis TaxID=795644 RepID=A0A8J3R6F8_9ACTN|nr:ArsR family transcriptional regulator [Sphaerimonospora thailandensis]
MQQPPPPIFPIFRSRITCAVLTHTYVGDKEHSITALAAATGTDSGTMAREVSRLERAGILASRHVGRTKLVRANHAAPFYGPLRDLVTIILGPAQVLSEELADVEGIEEAAIFGSWAARIHGESGPTPVDIDLLIIGRPDRDDLYDAAARAKSRLGREVNAVVVTRSRWEANKDGFIRELHSRPVVAVPLPHGNAA